MVKIINGKKLAQEKEKKLKKEVAAFKKKSGIAPKLVSIVIGENQAFHFYLTGQKKAAARVGILFEKKLFPAKIKPKQIYQYINSLNRDRGVQGIVIQLPLPKGLDSFWLVSKIDPEKDVDCLTPENLGLLMLGKPVFLPAVVKAVIEIIESAKFKVKSSNVVVVGASDFVGKPLAIHLKNLGATVVLCDEFTKNLKEWTRKGEILISATGVAGLIKKEMVKNGAMVIDAGSPQPEVDFKEVKKIASLITPVPGGVGPLTIACLLENVLLTAKRQFEQERILEERLKLSAS